MEKRAEVKFGTTKCDSCASPCTQSVGKGVYCDNCAERLKRPALEKEASVAPSTLGAAAIELADKHKPTE